ncbi:hypothetical protein LZ31DRAFT_590815 [Colletotrichum somersetense]|nr:hypothetical protein LZ31DRAFT_590815 [Colletotrichum somersetense]
MYDPLVTTYTVSLVLVGLVTISALALSVLFHFFTIRLVSGDVNSFRFVKYAKLGFRLFFLGNLIVVIHGAMTARTLNEPYDIYSSRYLTIRAQESISIPIQHFGAAAIFLSLFYLARILTLSQPDETSKGRGKKWAHGAAIWVLLASLTAMILTISVWAAKASDPYDDSSDSDMSYYIRGIVSFSLEAALYATHIICAIFVLVYIVKTRKKVLGTPLRKVSDLMLTAGILWLVRVVWLVLSIVLSSLVVSPYAGDGLGYFKLFLDVFLDPYLTFVVLVLLFVLATSEKYALAQPEQPQEPQEQEQEQRTKNMEQVV